MTTKDLPGWISAAREMRTESLTRAGDRLSMHPGVKEGEEVVRLAPSRWRKTFSTTKGWDEDDWMKDVCEDQSRPQA